MARMPQCDAPVQRRDAQKLRAGLIRATTGEGSLGKARKPAGTSAGNSPERGDGWQAEKSAMTRQTILEAAITCLVKVGYNRTTTSLIAEYAGVSRGAMMHHFPSRQAVIFAVVEYLRDRRLREYREFMDGIDRPESALSEAGIRKSVESAWRLVNLPSFVAYQELLVAARTDPDLGRVLAQTERDVERLFLGTIKQVFPRLSSLSALDLTNDLVQFSMRGMVLSHMASGKEQRAERLIGHIADALIGLYKQEGLELESG